MEEVFGYIERITFHSHETGYTVAQLKSPRSQDLICIVGTMSGLQPGETIRCQGEWKQHLAYGKQFAVQAHRSEAPADLLGIKKYLGSGLVKGIGQKYAARIVEKFQTETLDIIDQYPERLLEVEGLGKKRVDQIVSCWQEQRTIRDVMIFLQGNGVSPAYAQKIFKNYGTQSITQVKENPFQLARDVRGIGFKMADQIAQNLGISKDAIERVKAGIEYVLSEHADEGHVCYPLKELMQASQEMLEVDQMLIDQAIDFLVQEQRIEKQEVVYEGALVPFIWLRWLFLSEQGIARQLERLKYAQGSLRSIHTEKALEWVQTELAIQLAENQKVAVAQAFIEKVQIITGGPGTGKSTITKAILAITERLSSNIILAAPTGRAAKRMAEITGKKAKTIHSLLEYDFTNGKFKKGPNNPLECDLIIVDEASMIDTQLMYSLLKAIPDYARVIFVGDIHQLPSVGPGNVLKDIISSKTISVTTLNEIFRQAAGSQIITNAHRINKGTFPDLRNLKDGDFFFIESEEPEAILKDIVSLVSHRLPKKYQLNPIDAIQVLAPMRRGVIGTENLNTVLQAALAPREPIELNWGGKRFLIGDKVMQIRNNYKREVYNGDIGRIRTIDFQEQQVMVVIDDQEVLYDFSDLDELVLAYAVSIHKYQGSECPCVIIPVHTTHFKLLHRNLLYTGVTRGKKLVVLVGTKKAIMIAVQNDEVRRRYTGLMQALSLFFSPKMNRIFPLKAE